MSLLGRDAEVTQVTDVIARSSTGRSGTLVVHGEAGVGKSALVEHVLEVAAAGRQVERIVAAESEAELPYAGLDQACRPWLGLLDRLPGPQADALGAALGLRASNAPPSRFLVGLAVVGLLAEASGDGPLVCVFDDAQWLDAASRAAIAFAGRRLGAESVALLVLMREPGDEFRGLPHLHLEGLPADVAGTLLNRALHAPVDPRVRAQLIAEAAGNPLALRELPRTLISGRVAGGYALSEAMPLSRRIERSLLEQLAPLPDAARRLLLVAAADPTGDAAILWRAQQELGLGPDAADAAERSGMLTLGVRASFRHPLVRSAVYRAATDHERRVVHAALAKATDANDPDRAAWHAAHAARDPDEPIAAALERSAVRARARGGEAASAAFFERSAELSPAPVDHARRLLAAAQARLEAASPAAAQTMLDAIAVEHLSRADRASMAWLRARIDFGLRGDPASALDLVAAGRELLPLARDRALTAFEEGMYIGLFSAGFEGRGARAPADPRATRYAQIGTAVLAALEAGDEHGDFRTRLLRGQALRAQGRRQEAYAVLRDVAAELRTSSVEALASWTGLANNAALDVWDAAATRAHVDRQVDGVRKRGDLIALPNALSLAGTVRILDGQLDAVDAISDELDVLKDALGHPFPRYNHMLAAAWRGDAERFRRWAAELCDGALERGDASALSTANFAAATLANGLGRYADAVRAGRQELPYVRATTYSARIACELVEAATRTGETALAERALDAVTWMTESLTTDWALGALADARAQLATGDEAETLHRQAVEHLDRAQLPLYAARARLTYGEWLRRQRRRADAREVLRAAHAVLSGRGAHAFAARAARELEATGETTAARDVAVAAPALTSQELNVARLARDGLSNREIGARLFISVRTVEYHLRKVFQKLGVVSRRELRDVMPDR